MPVRLSVCLSISECVTLFIVARSSWWKTLAKDKCATLNACAARSDRASIRSDIVVAAAKLGGSNWGLLGSHLRVSVLCCAPQSLCAPEIADLRKREARSSAFGLSFPLVFVRAYLRNTFLRLSLPLTTGLPKPFHSLFAHLNSICELLLNKANRTHNEMFAIKSSILLRFSRQ